MTAGTCHSRWLRLAARSYSRGCENCSERSVLEADRRGDARVDMSAIAKVVSSIWSIHVCCHKAVALQCRSMCVVLASELLRHDWLWKQCDLLRLKLLLKSVWRGTTVWTRETSREIVFWFRVVFNDLVECASLVFLIDLARTLMPSLSYHYARPSCFSCFVLHLL